jgi:hypothetical protein
MSLFHNICINLLLVVFFLLDESLASEFNVLTFQNTDSSIFIGGVSRNIPAYTTFEDGTDTVFCNIST